MRTGTMQTGNTIHKARYIREKDGVKLYVPLCNKRMTGALCYLFLQPLGTEPTCKRCLAIKE